MSGALTSLIASIGSGLSVTANDVTGTRNDFGSSGTVTSTQLPNTTPKGGKSPYAYTWIKTGGTGSATIDDPDAQNPRWTATVSDGSPDITNWKVVVTDANSNTAETTITVSLYFYSLS